MTLKNTHILLLILFSLCWGKSLEGQGSLTQVYGTVTSAYSEDISFHFHKDLISYEEIQFEIKLNEANRFGTQFMLTEPLNAEILYLRTVIPLLIFPGDSLNITFDALNPAQNISFSGTGANQNKWFFDATLAFREFSEEVLNQEIVEREPSAYLTYLERVYQTKLRYFETWSRGRDLPLATRQFIKTDLDYWRAYELLRYPFVKTAMTGRDYTNQLPAYFFSFLSRVMLNNVEMLSSENYRNFLDRLSQLWKESPSQREALVKQFSELEVVAPQMLVLAHPDQSPVLANLGRGSFVKDLKDYSEIRSSIQIENEFVEGRWMKVKTGEGIVGYANEAGLVGISSTTPERLVDLLHGKVLAFQLAKNYYWNSDLPGFEIKERMSAIQDAGEYRSLVMEDDDLNLTAIEGIHLRSPQILSSIDVNLLFGEEPPIIEPPSIPDINNTAILSGPLPNLTDNYRLTENNLEGRLSGQILGGSTRGAFLEILTDQLQMKKKRVSLTLDSEGNFSHPLEIQSETIADLIIDGKKIPVVLEPGATTVVSVDRNSIESSLSFGGQFTSANRVLSKIYFSRSEIQNTANKIMLESSGDSFTAFLDQNTSKWLEELNQQDGINSIVFSLVESEIQSWKALQLFNFPWEKPLRLNQNAPLQMEESYYQFIDLVRTEDEALFGNPTFLDYLDQLLEHRKSQS
ncbi:MAG: hypothetical protein HKN16_01035, partial [Saprospiraceae bacterium]|nr:hypothetical protein [Saprospiraceae bacterium]